MSDTHAEKQNLETSLNNQMRCGLLSSPTGDIMIIHDQPIPKEVEWIEFDPKAKKFSLIDNEGGTIDLGVEINDNMSKNLSHGSDVMLVHIENSRIINERKISIVIQDY